MSTAGRIAAAGGVHGFPAALTSFIGRDGPVREVAGLLEERRLVTVTGPGGWGKTGWPPRWPGGWRTGSPTGVRLAELAPVANPALVPSVVAVALGMRELAARAVPAPAVARQAPATTARHEAGSPACDREALICKHVTGSRTCSPRRPVWPSRRHHVHHVKEYLGGTHR